MPASLSGMRLQCGVNACDDSFINNLFIWCSVKHRDMLVCSVVSHEATNGRTKLLCELNLCLRQPSRP